MANVPWMPGLSKSATRRAKAQARAVKRDRKRRNKVARSDKGKPQLISEELLLRTRKMYENGHSFRTIAQAIIDRTEYASEKSLAVALHNTFRARGWHVRTRLEAAKDARWRTAPRCTWRSAKGRRCRHRTENENGLCARHQPGMVEDRLRELRERNASGRK